MFVLTTTNLLNASLCSVFLFISSRALYFYARVRSARMFILGLSTGIVALTAAADFVSGSLVSIQLSTDWFLYIGQTVSYMFIFLSLLLTSEHQLYKLIRWHVLISLLALLFLILSPILPDLPNAALRMALSGSRCIICFVIFFYYVTVFATKETRFSLLMLAGFMLLSFGYLMIMPKYLLPGQELLDHMGDIIRIIGVLTLLLAFIVG